MGTLNPNGPEATTQNPNGKYPDSLIEQKPRTDVTVNVTATAVDTEVTIEAKGKKKGK